MRKLLLLNFICAFQALTIFAQAPAITYSSPNTFITGTAITPLSPTNTGGAVPIGNYAEVTTYAGNNTFGSTNGPLATASFWIPTDIEIDHLGNIYILEGYKIRKIDAAGIVTTFAGSYLGFADGEGTAAAFWNPTGIGIDKFGNLYVADTGNNRIRKITPSGTVTTIAGTGTSGSANGASGTATFNAPKDIVVDQSGNVYVSENFYVRKISTSSMVSTLAGNGTSSILNSPIALAIDTLGNVYAADYGNHTILKITSAGVTSTIAGFGMFGFADGAGSLAKFWGPRDIDVDASGIIYVADAGNNRIRKITPNGTVTTLAGNGNAGAINDEGTVATFDSPTGVSLDGHGNLYVTDRGNNLVRKISLSGYSISPTLPTGLSFSSSSGIISGTPTSISSPTTYFLSAGNHSGTSIAAVEISIVNTTPPVISSFSPTSAKSGSVVTIIGTDLLSTTSVIIGGVAVTTFNASSSTTITAVVPPNAVSGSITVTNPYGTSTLAGFTYTAPIISYVTPQTYFTGAAITPMAPTNTGGAVPALSYAEVSTLAGNVTSGSADATGTAARFNLPTALVTDASGNMYVADQANHKIRKITPSGDVTTFAGSGYAGSADGSGSAASFNSPRGIAIDAAGNVYVADYLNHKIRKITPTGGVSTLAGSGVSGFANGQGTTAIFNNPSGVAVDNASGLLYIADEGNNLIRKITSSGAVTTFAGNSSAGSSDGSGLSSSFNKPSGVAVDLSGNIYVADFSSNKIRKINSSGFVNTLAGSGSANSIDGTGTSASFRNPTNVAVDNDGNVYVSESGHFIRKVTSLGVVTRLAGLGISGSLNGVGSSSRFNNPTGIALDGLGNLYVADQNNHLIRKVIVTGYSINPALPTGLSLDGATGIISGTPTVIRPSTNYTIDAHNSSGVGRTILSLATVIPPIAPSITSFTGPAGIDDGILITGTHLLGATSVSIGGVPAVSFSASSPTSLYAVVASGASSGSVTVTNPYGSATLDGFIFIQPPAIAYTGPQKYIIGTSITPLSPSSTGGTVSSFREVTTFAGTTGVSGSTDATGTAARFNLPSGVVTDTKGNVYVADDFNHKIRKITPSGAVTTFAGTGSPGSTNGPGSVATFNQPRGIAIDADGNIFVADGLNHKIRKITPEGVVSTFAGSGAMGTTNGVSTSATFRFPAGVAVDSNGDLYVADSGNHLIRKITSSGLVSTFAGSGNIGFVDAIGTAASFYNPIAVALDLSGNLYVADNQNHRIRKITPAAEVRTLAGSGGQVTIIDPSGVVVSSDGNIYVTGNNSIQKITPQGMVSDFAGSAVPGSANGFGPVARFNWPTGIAFDGLGSIYVADMANKLIRRIVLANYTYSPLLPAGLNFDFYTGTISGTPTVVTPPTVYTIRGYNTSGVSTATVTISTTLSPTITSISPSTAALDSAVIITGTNFTGATAVSFGGIAAASFIVTSPTSITAIVGSGASGDVSVTTPEGTATISGFIFVPRPTVSAGSATTFILGGSVVLSASPGSGYTYQWLKNGIDINDASNATYTVTESGDYTVRITLNSVSQVSAATTVNVLPVPVPTITSISPSTAVSSTTVTLTGTNFTGATAVSFGGTAATSFSVISPTSITAVVGSGTSGNASVTTGYGTSTLAGFNFVPVPVITAGGVTTFILGGSVMLTASPGSGFAYQWLKNGIDISGASNATYAATESGAYTVRISLNSVSQVSAATTVNVLPVPVPTITSVNPFTAVSGTTVTLTGTNFTGATAVNFGGTAATSFNVVSSTSITAVVGSGTSGNVSVTTGYGTATLSGFNFVPLPIITAGGVTTFISGGNVVLTASPGSGFSYQWLKNGVNISGATNAAYTATESGAFSVRIALNSISQVSNTITVNTIFGLPATNFKLIANSATCNGLNNGSIKIKATQKLNYSASIGGNSIPFTDSLKIDNLLPGTYNVCITVAGQPDYQQCYTTVIAQPKELSVYTAVSNSGYQVVLSLSGSDWYKINLNGTNYTTSDNQITLPLTKGTNTISVSSNTSCQGVIEKSIRVNYNPVVYPNPFDTILNLNLNNESTKTAGINVYTLDGKLVFSVKNAPIVAGIAQVDLSTLITGEYVLKLITDQSNSIFRIIKR